MLAACLAASTAGCKEQARSQWVSHERTKALDPRLQQQIGELLTTYTGTADQPKLLGGSGADASRLQHGQAVYEARCIQCHGATGDGAGPAARHLQPLPRDYRLGVFKFTSTPFGAKPRRSDLLRTLRRGIPGTSMPSFALLPEQDLQDVVDYVLVLTHRGELEQELVKDAEDAGEIDPQAVPDHAKNILDKWQEADRQTVMPDSAMPEFAPESIAAGREAFLTKGCSKCHGEQGRGGAGGKVEIGKDNWGNTAIAADLTSGMFRGGGRPIDIYRRIHSGINGTPMPAFGGALEKEPEKIWQLVHYVKHLGDQRRASLPTLDSLWKRSSPHNSSTEHNVPPAAQPTEPADGR
jgi:mono/diheme cytochrome c family protein